ncbi:terminase large subunit [Halalkalibacterium halodurans]|uniref:terminase large subunit n=1 Tax=Halalkalibacterium halodurans TaxID=86665 RepID=UPI002AA9CC7D|nr:terminase large subunit [Halalkalibacterium halodurans]MDY7222077.1 terminase large subunit [Halalkalibacterium halodurans]MDY7243904.1 terminase large subunit [Halalkalibacterium halodurans]
MKNQTSSRNTKLKTTEYAVGVTSHVIIASKKVYLACKRHLRDLKRQGIKDFPYIFDEAKGYRPIGFIEKFCKPSQGNFDKIIMQPWQHFVIGSLYGWIHKDTGYRRFREGLIMVARKNGKSALGSGVSLYGCSKDGEKGARVYQLANSKAQARVLFNECKAMVETSPVLNKHFERTLSEIRFNDTLSKIEPLATDSEKLDGLSASLGLFDEIHEYKNYKLINVIKNSTGARKQPLMIYITTAGYQLDGPLVDYYEHADDVLNGVVEAERFFYYIAELDAEDDIEDPNNWIKANPNLGVTIDLETMIEEWNDRKHIPAERADFITKRLNVFVKSDQQSFIDYEVLKRNEKELPMESLDGLPCVGSFDLSETEDFTSACLEFPLPESGEVFVLSHSWVPQKKVSADNEKINYRELEDSGLLTIVPGDYINYDYIFSWFEQMAERYTIEKIAYDPHNAFHLIKALEAHGFNTVPVRQGHLTLSQPLKHLKEMFLDGKVVYNKNKLLKWYINNVKLVQDRNNNWMPTKQNRYRKIDGFAALLTAHSEVMKMLVEPMGSGKVGVISLSDLRG